MFKQRDNNYELLIRDAGYRIQDHGPRIRHPELWGKYTILKALKPLIFRTFVRIRFLTI